MKAPKITVSIGADSSKLKKEMSKADGIISKFSKGASLAFDGLAVAAGAAAFKIGQEGVQSAIEDQQSQVKLAKALKNTTKATDAQVASVEDYISTTQLRYGKSDVALRASLAKLATATGSVTKAQKLQSIALDVAAGSGISLEAATNLVAKAQLGSFTGFKKLGVALDENITKTKNVDAATKILAEKFSGSAAAAADTMQGKMDRLNEKWGEAEEAIGGVILQGLEPLMDWFNTPEADAIINDFVKQFGDGIKTVAENLPSVVADLKRAGSAVANSPLTDIFGDPKLLAAAAAFAKMPGPWQVKMMAAVAAYMGVTQLTDGSTPADIKAANKRFTDAIFGANRTEAQKTAAFSGTFSDLAAQRSGAYQTAGINPNAVGYRGNTTIINVNGVVDGKSAAKAVNNALKNANANGVSTSGRTGGR